MADSLFRAGDYPAASIEYERFLYHYPTDPAFPRVKLQKALCYRHVGNYESALRELAEISILRTDEALLSRIYYERSLNHYLLGQDHEALLNLSRIQLGAGDDSLKQAVWPLTILASNRLRNFDTAHVMLGELVRLSTLPASRKHALQLKVDSLYAAKHLPRAFSPQRARHLSQFVPGAGQAWSGHPGEGAVSLLLNAALLGFGVHQLWFSYYWTAYIAAFTVFNKTYFGGMERAEFLAGAETLNRMAEFNEDVLEVLREVCP
ncbi:MAG TPA: hypothetical protein P5550_02915 [Bacteroidales bacterium]|nr:hypothetical protein [Bacteroidales bacterium]HRZ77163.1 hypothetical protein [Bacteroidales bacterium]